MAGNDQIGNNEDRFYYMSDVNNGADNTVNWGERLDYNPGGGFLCKSLCKRPDWLGKII